MMKSIWGIPRCDKKELKSPKQVLIGLGSSLGDRVGHLRMGLLHLSYHRQIQVGMLSKVWQTQPLGNAKNPFLNMCARVQTTLSPREMLNELFKIELSLKRIRGVHWMDRTLDLDLLLYEEVIINTPSLQVPHPRMLDRSFVMIPALEIAGDMNHPILDRVLSDSEQTSNLAMWSVGRFVFVKA